MKWMGLYKSEPRSGILFNGQVVLDTFLPSHRSCRISIIKPSAVCASKRVQFLVKGFNFWSKALTYLVPLQGYYVPWNQNILSKVHSRFNFGHKNLLPPGTKSSAVMFIFVSTRSLR